jgi:hypothetical protein
LKLELTSAAKSTKLLVACKQLIKTRNRICKDGFCNNFNLSCVTSAVIDVRKKVGFEDYIVRGSALRDKILKLHQKYANLINRKTLKWNSSLYTFTKI